MIHHCGITACTKSIPANQVARRLGIRAPLPVFQELLTHEELGYSRRSQQESGGKTRAASGVPGTRVRAIGQSGNSGVASRGHEIMILNTGDCLPTMREPLGIEIAGETSKSTVALRPCAA